MKIVLIGQSFEKNSGQGVYEFSNNLYEHLKKINKNIEIIKTGSSKNSIKTLFNNILVSFFRIINVKADVYHFMMPEIALACLLKKPSIVTIHDLIPLTISWERKKIFNIYFKFMMKIALRSSHLIAISNSTKKDLIKLFNIAENKISVIQLGVNNKKFYPLKDKGKNKKFIIGYLGGFGKRKNIEYILKIANEFKNDKKIIFKIAGKGPKLNNLVRLKKEMKLDNIEFVGFISDENLNEFYNSLDLFLFPSLYEGFGLPVLEAMACGIPVMISNISSLPEIAGDAGILINLRKAEETIEKIKELIKNKKKLKRLSQKSIKRAKEFNWEKTAKETIKVYKKVI